MEQKHNEYYPIEKPFVELKVSFFGNRMNPKDIIYYNKLNFLSKKMKMHMPEFIVNSDFFSFGYNLHYSCRTILNGDNDKIDKITILFNELKKYKENNTSDLIIEFIYYGEKIRIFTPEDLNMIFNKKEKVYKIKGI